MRREEIGLQIQSVIKEVKHDVTFWWLFACITSEDGLSKNVSICLGSEDAKYLVEQLSEKK